MKKRKAMNELAIMMIVGVLMGLLIFMATSNILNLNFSSDYRRIAEAKTIEIRNSLLYLNTVEEGVKVMNVPDSFEVMLRKDNVSVECNVPIFCSGGVSHTRSIKPINKNIIVEADVNAEKICISKKISNCQNQITICELGGACCDFEDLSDTLCTSSNPYD